ncbi:TonB family protein [Psychrobacter sp. NG25]|uniref:TonB family protein n=1 Tax=Psychrobacter sp. NG25 TaxID=2782005 RepID=UPI00188467EA|nr:TonB family protein [Psychrobacter sp. NG25]MBF0659214.1 TonB family protein [Psychrobacter sp. NG25]
MSSTNLDAPSPKLTLATIAVVVGLHVLTAVALAAVKTPEMKVEPEKVTPPIEIELITFPPPPPPVEIEEIKVEEKPKPVEKLDTKLKAKPVTAPVVKKSTKPVKDPSINKPAAASPSNNNPPDELPPESTDNTTDNNDQTDLGGVVDNSTTTVVQVETNLGKKPTIDTSTNNNKGSNSPISTGAGKKNTGGSNEGVNQKETTPPVDTGPVSLGAGEASWRSGREPRLGFLAKESSLRDKGSISVTAAITVDEKGNITNVSISPGTDIRSVDNKIKRAIKKAKLKPFIRNGVAVRGTVSLPVRYDLP